MAVQSHRIGELRFRFKAPDAITAESFGRAVEAMAEDRLLPLIEAAFDRLAPDRVLVIDRLEFDLGALGADPTELLQAFEEALVRLKASSSGKVAEDTATDPVVLIAEFLQRGGLALPDPGAALQAAWAEVACLPKQQLARALARLAPVCGDDRAARRLLTTAPAGLLEAMARALAGLPERANTSLGKRSLPDATVLSAIRALAGAPEVPAVASVFVAALTGEVAQTAPIAKRLVLPLVDDPAPGPEPPPPPVPAKAQEMVPLAVPAAGLVLLHPFLSPYFDSLGLLAGPGRFSDTHARSLAVRLAQRLATGADTAPEADCVLAKLLCGLDPDEALLSDGTRAPSAERIADEGNRLLTAVIGHWAKLGRTSPEGLREAFLRRPGLVCRTGDGWRLSVERRGTDVLLDSLPWSIGLIRTPFMATLLRVDWR
jgi:hypothetical protein